MNAPGAGHSQAAETFVKKLLAHLDECDVDRLQQALPLFQPHCRIVVNTQPFASPAAFLQTWLQAVVATQHTLTSLDYHVIPGTATLVCNAACKVRFDESGRDKMGGDAVLPAPAARAQPRARRWGTYYGLSLQLVLDERVLAGDAAAAIAALNYTLVFRPDDTLMSI
ncbi:AER089Wp [Eremothecium gossypii ATCC 10895]|uniref:AER089Wp n=1 Tax=Eremothecium gossypii (strain ATCC 10895 / CBS 109.51 / FGSC 9923 / NRRL Y-1056) TaxID=284811 RepID=Q757C4_EREGS|nr:AER089Wp [Eremothecium gossypii ATCC 10895]AAS52773.1 AER089Wp [Eremothecium gossypii ATCC 10895]AEY97079.1 FAER089Wp [Eremothecium gossypii FDAG1]